MTDVPNFYLDFNVRGAERKRLVEAIAAYMQEDAVYQKAPSFAYQVDYLTIDKDGVVSFDSRADSEEIEGLIEVLAEQGFVSVLSNLGLPEDELVEEATAEPAPSEPTVESEPVVENTHTEELVAEAHDCSLFNTPASEPNVEAETDEHPEENVSTGQVSADPDGNTMVIELPMDCVDMANLEKLLEAKGGLIKKALGLESLPVKPGKDTVVFHWFPVLPEPDEIQARIHLITALAQMSKRQKRVTATEKDVSSEKYAFRCFLLRLGFIGEEYKAERKILLKNLSGNSSHK